MKAFVVALSLVAACSSQENLGFTTLGQPRWAVSLGESSDDSATAIAIDSVGDVVVAGTFLKPRDVGGEIDEALCPFITKRTASDGAELWTRELVGAESGGSIDGVAIGPQDTVIVVGVGVGTFTLGERTLTMSPNGSMFVAAFAPTGELLWVTTTSNHYWLASSLVVDEDGRIFLTGRGSFSDVDGVEVAFVAAFDAFGNFEWDTTFQAFQASAGYQPEATKIAIAANGDLLVTGRFFAPTSFGGAVIDPESGSRPFLARLRRDGSYVASQAIGPTSPMVSFEPNMIVDPTGRIVIQHRERDFTDRSAPPETWPELTALRVFDDSGHELWSSHVPNRGNIVHLSPRTLASTRDGLIISSAWTDEPYSGRQGAMEVFAYDADGTQGLATFGSRPVPAWNPPDATGVSGTAVSATGEIAFTGTYDGGVDLGTGPLFSHGPSGTIDIFIVMIDRPAPQ
jgi:outer membrane protein assembly factor BamB